MALFTNFAVECETHHAIAAIAQRFAGRSLAFEGVEVLIERSGVFEKDGLWYFHADPGYINGWHSLPSLNTARAYTAVDYEANPAKYKMPPSQSPAPAPGHSSSSPP